MFSPTCGSQLRAVISMMLCLAILSQRAALATRDGMPCEYWGVGLCTYDGSHQRPERCTGQGRRYCDRAPEATICPAACRPAVCSPRVPCSRGMSAATGARVHGASLSNCASRAKTAVSNTSACSHMDHRTAEETGVRAFNFIRITLRLIGTIWCYQARG